MQQPKPFLHTIRSIDFECLLLNTTDDQQSANIIFLNGYRMKLNSWDKVYPEVAKQHNVLLYNRQA